MYKNPLILIDDDKEDCDMFTNACAEMNIKNEVIIFDNSALALGYFKKMLTQPYCILCDINMPLINGLELREKMNSNNNLRSKAIPFLYWSNLDSNNFIEHASSLHIQGFFRKPDTIESLKLMVLTLINYCELFQFSDTQIM